MQTQNGLHYNNEGREDEDGGRGLTTTTTTTTTKTTKYVYTKH